MPERVGPFALGTVVRIVGLAVLVALAYSPVATAGFVWDDDANVTGNTALRSWEGLVALWLEPGTTTQYYPLVYTSFWIEYALFELAPLAYHVDNVLLHLGCSLVLWRILVLFGLPGAWLAAAVFALHPVHVESVAWVTERKNVLSGFFYLASAWLYLSRASDVFRPATAVSKRSTAFAYAGSLLLFCAALLSKSPAASLPAALLLIVWWKKGRLVRSDVLPILPFFVVGAPIALLTIAMEAVVGDVLGFSWAPNLLERLVLLGRAPLFYLGKLAWPVNQSFVYPRWDLSERTLLMLAYPLAAAALLGALLFMRRRIGRGPITAMLYFGGTLVPVLGFLEIYYFRFSLVADHWQYLASIGPIVLGVCGACGFVEARAAREGSSLAGPRRAAGILLAGLAVLTFQQTTHYKDSETLWRASLRTNPNAAMVHYNLAGDLEARGDREGAMHHYREAIEIEPWTPNAYNNLALMHAADGRSTTAIELLDEATRVAPDYVRGRWNLGMLYTKQGRLDLAIPRFERAIEIALETGREPSEIVNSRAQLAGILMRAKENERARFHIEAALRSEPEHIEALLQAGILDTRSGDRRSAIRRFEQVLALEPGHPMATKKLAHLEAKSAAR